MDVLYDEERGLGHLFAGAVYITAPYVATFANGASITLLAYAALPWLLVFVHRGLDSPRGWRWPALGALLIAVMGGGVNAAVLAWIVFGALALVAYEVAGAGTYRERSRARSPVANGALHRARLGLVDRPRAGSGLRGRPVPRVHRAPGDDLGDDEPLGVGARTGLLGALSGRAQPNPCARSPTTTSSIPSSIVATFMVPLVAIAGLRRTRRGRTVRSSRCSRWPRCW